MSTAPREPAATQPRRNVVLWAGLLLGMVGFAAEFQAVYAASMWSCVRGDKGPLHAVAAVALALTLASLWIAWRNGRSVGGEPTEKDEGEVARVRLLSSLGVMLSLLLVAAVAAQWIGIFLLPSCPE